MQAYNNVKSQNRVLKKYKEFMLLSEKVTNSALTFGRAISIISATTLDMKNRVKGARMPFLITQLGAET